LASDRDGFDKVSILYPLRLLGFREIY